MQVLQDEYFQKATGASGRVRVTHRAPGRIRVVDGQVGQVRFG